MLNGVGKFRNSRPREGYPIALLYVPTAAPSDGASTHTLSTLAKAKPGDTVYWRGHEGFYLGEGRYLHSNGLSYNNRLNSLLPLDPAVEAPARTDLYTYDSIYTFGTPFPQFPQEIRVGAFWAANESGRKYRFLARLDGYCPNRVEIYPFGVDAAGNPLGQDLTANNPVIISRRGGSDVNTGATDANTLRYMLFDSPFSESANVPAYDYPIAGTFTPAVKFFNDPSLVPDKSAVKGYLPEGTAKIESAVFKMPNPVVVR
jgi:hypothetical protein